MKRFFERLCKGIFTLIADTMRFIICFVGFVVLYIINTITIIEDIFNTNYTINYFKKHLKKRLEGNKITIEIELKD